MLCTVLALNQAAGAMVSAALLNSYTPQIKPNSEKIKRDPYLSPNLDAWDYALMANSIVQRQSTGKWDCKDYAIVTKEVYLQLITENEREDLENKIRIVANFPAVAGERGHVWLEVERDGKFTPFEAYSYKHDKSQINGNADKEDWIMARSFNGTRIFHPTLESFFYPGGLVRMLYLSQTVAKEKE